MATEQRKRRTVLLAVLLALLVAGTLCVWGAAAAGYSFSSPALQAFMDFIGRGDVAQNGDGSFKPGADGAGDGSGDTGSGDEGEGSGATDGNNCFLGFICANAAANADGDLDQAGGDNAILNASADAEEDANCFLGLVCVHADSAANVDDGDDLDVDSDSILEVDEDGADADLDADAAEGTEGDNESCFLGLVCTNSLFDAISQQKSNAKAS
jgi:hypothetical protein